ncbi:hypothetical protein C0583_04400 [Candidatus Parcubacteria bacterium]|nr:MAG: hypothetical protein C0583_04400 [Candidatus Parcubacteria bacterium]
MFNKEEKTVSRPGTAETIIGPSIKVKGDFHGDGDIIIEGEVEGEVTTKSHLEVGSKASILANISAKSAKIAGKIKGDVKVKGYLELLNSANISGNIEATEISIEKGARIDGNLKMSQTHH